MRRILGLWPIGGQRRGFDFPRDRRSTQKRGIQRGFEPWSLEIAAFATFLDPEEFLLRRHPKSEAAGLLRKMLDVFAGRWQAQYSRDAIFAIYRKLAPTLRQRSDAPKTENGGPWTDRLIQNWDWLPVWIEPDRPIRGIIDHKPNRFAKRGDPFREAIKHLPHETHRSLSSVKVDLEEFLDADDCGVNAGVILRRLAGVKMDHL